MPSAHRIYHAGGGVHKHLAPPPFFGGPPDFKKKGENVAYVCANTLIVIMLFMRN